VEELDKPEDKFTVTVFLTNTDVGKYLVNIISDVQAYSSCDFHCIALESNLLVPNQWNTIAQQFYSLRHKLEKCTLFAADLMDELAIKLATDLTSFTNKFEFLLYSQWRSVCKVSPNQLINKLPESLNTVFPLILTRITPTIKHWELFDASCYNLNYQNILELQTYFCQSKVTITELNLSNNNLTTVSTAVISALILSCQVKKFHLKGNHFDEFNFCDGIAIVLSHSTTRYKHSLQVEVIFTNSNALLLCNLHSAISNINLTLSTAAKIFHFVMVNCKFNSYNSLLKSLSQCSSLSSVHLWNNCLQLTELENMVVGMLNVKYIIHDSDFTIFNTNRDSASYLTDLEPTHSLMEMNNSIQMQWLSPHQHGDLNSYINFIVKVKEFKFETSFMQALKVNGTLNSLLVRNGCIPTYLAKEISALLEDNKALRYFELRKTCLQDLDLREILQSLKVVTELRYLVIDSINNIRYETATKIKQIISSNSKLEHIEVIDCNLMESAIINIANGMIVMNSLKHVSFTGNNISNTAAEILAFALANQPNLHYVDFSSSNLQESGIIHIVSALEKFNLLHFALNNCKITVNAANEIVSNLLRNTSTISYFTMSNCEFQNSSIFSITKALSTLSTLQVLNLWSRNAGDSPPAAYIMESLVCNNIALKELKLLIGMSNIVNFLKSLKYLSSLKCIDINFEEKYSPGDSNIYVIECPQHLYLELNTDTNYMEIVTDSNDLTSNLDLSNASSTINTTMVRVGKLFASALQNKQITHLTLNNCKYEAMFYALNSLSSLQYLNVKSSSLNTSIVNAIKHSHDLRHINISNCAMPETLLHQICESMSILRLLDHLDISKNKLTMEAARLISVVIENNCLLRYLDISECGECSNWLFKAMKHLQYLSYLNAGYTGLSGTSCIQLSVAFICNKELVFISLQHCEMNANDFALVAKSLVNSANLRHLDLANNFANDDVTSTIGKVVTNNASLEYLNLSFSIMTVKGLKMITSSLKNNKFLKHIDLGNSIIDCPAAIDLAAIISVNTGLEYINLSNCWFQNTGMQWLFHSLKLAPLINYCYLGSNILKLDDAKKSNLIKLRNVVIAAKEIKDITDYRNTMDYMYYDDCALSSELKVAGVSESGDSYSQNEAIFAASVEVASIKMCDKSFHYFTSYNFQDNRIIERLDNTTCLHFLQSSSNIKEDIKLVLRNDFMIEYLKVSKVEISDDECCGILSAFETSTYLQYLVVKANNLCDEVTNKISFIMQNNQKLKFVDLSNCGLSHQQIMSYITLVLSGINCICHLDLSANRGDELSNNTQSDFARLPLIHNASLKYLNLAYCMLPNKLMSSVLLMLSRCASLSYINLQSCITSKGVLLPSVIASNNALKYLNVSKCNLQEKDIIGIAKYLRINYSIQHLLLSFNVITDNAAAEIALTICKSSLEQLSISDCKLRQLGMLCIADALKKMVTLQHLDLSYNTISDEAAINIASALSNNTSLEYLDMSYCTWQNDGLVVIQETLDLEKFTMLKEVDLTTQ